jgi:DNA-binding MarR family transcriptional regulator
MPRPASSSAKAALKLDDFLCFAVYSAGHAFTRVYKPLLDRLGLTYPQYLVMVVLWEEDGQTVGSLADRLFLESSTLTPMLKRLEAMDLVSRRRDRTDERVVRIELTEPGRALREQARDVPDCIVDASGLNGAELKTLQQQIKALRASLAAATAP